jgi:hypothetical protein
VTGHLEWPTLDEALDNGDTWPQPTAGAHISPCGLYRYDLWRQWSTAPKLAFVMLNPSTADALTNDQTIEACIRFAKRDGYGGIVVRNLFAFRTVSPRILADAHRHGVDVVGEHADVWLGSLMHSDEAEAVGGVVAAWGKGSGIPKQLMEERIEMVMHDVLDVQETLALHPDPYRGQSPHPLYLKNDTPIGDWPARRAA